MPLLIPIEIRDFQKLYLLKSQKNGTLYIKCISTVVKANKQAPAKATENKYKAIISNGASKLSI